MPAGSSFVNANVVRSGIWQYSQPDGDNVADTFVWQGTKPRNGVCNGSTSRQCGLSMRGGVWGGYGRGCCRHLAYGWVSAETHIPWHAPDT